VLQWGYLASSCICALFLFDVAFVDHLDSVATGTSLLVRYTVDAVDNCGTTLVFVLSLVMSTTVLYDLDEGCRVKDAVSCSVEVGWHLHAMLLVIAEFWDSYHHCVFYC
jgi:hypothetical protein